MINTVFASGQLSECDLTLRDLHLIAKNFTRILSSIYHQRIAYAEPAEKGAEKPSQAKKADKPEQEEESSPETLEGLEQEANDNDKENMDSGNPEQEQEGEDKQDGDSSSSNEDLKRLGI